MICDVNWRGVGCREICSKPELHGWLLGVGGLCAEEMRNTVPICMSARRYLPMYCTRSTFGWTALEQTPRLAAGCKIQINWILRMRMEGWTAKGELPDAVLF